MSSPSSVAAAILNGGSARRMDGANKAQLVVDGVSIADTQLALLRPRTSPIAMVVATEGQLSTADVELICDRVGGQGPLDGIAAALAWSPHPWVLVIACDMPHIEAGLVDYLIARRDESADIVACEVAGRVQPLLALYHRRLLPTLDAMLEAGQRRASALLSSPPEGVAVRLVEEEDVRRIDPEMKSFRNLNAPEDLFPA